ncbi:TIGR03620 family F420-dependent LLM class oxidoreductase [Phenylobacterium sp.]|jgi:probable F420-dependent oxidoreductase|uniref:TIGR03620 family F420-dependent LLM class oxidoreductase n=1 Tax=Phenylobacterium sp. TaxID=1871053 RepID=UPI002F3FF69A
MSTQASPAKPAARLGRVGVWSGELRRAAPAARAEAAAELDALGYGAIWMPGGIGGEILADVRALLDATRRASVGTGIINIWKHEPAELGAWWRGLPAELQARTMLGLGASHGPLIGAEYGRPLATMRAFLDGLDAEGVPVQSRCLAALAPGMLDLSRDRSAGTHPYLVPPEHTAVARARVGPDALVAPEQGVILETDPARAREIARQAVGVYLGLPNYLNNWRRLGYSEDDVTGFSDRLCDAVFAWGTTEQIAARVKAHFDAGADHVCLQVLRGAPGSDMSLPTRQWRELAAALL